MRLGEVKALARTQAMRGILGVGRLGCALAAVWGRSGPVTVWSRRGPRPIEGVTPSDAVRWVTDWTEVFRAEKVVVAIPGTALLELFAQGGPPEFTGLLISADVSLRTAVLRRLFPRAMVVRITPFLVDGLRSIPLLALRLGDLSEVEWSQAVAELQHYGEVDVVADEGVFEVLRLFGSPWPIVLTALLDTVGPSIADLGDRPDVMAIGQRLFYRALRSLLADLSDGRSGGRDSVATPGGITESGLQEIPHLTNELGRVFQKVRNRAIKLRIMAEDQAES